MANVIDVLQTLGGEVVQFPGPKGKLSDAAKQAILEAELDAAVDQAIDDYNTTQAAYEKAAIKCYLLLQKKLQRLAKEHKDEEDHLAAEAAKSDAEAYKLIARKIQQGKLVPNFVDIDTVQYIESK